LISIKICSANANYDATKDALLTACTAACEKVVTR